MGLDELLALIISIVFTFAYVYMLLKKTHPYIKQTHRISLLKERSDLITAEAEIVEVETRELNGLKADPNKLYVMRIRYPIEKAECGIEYSELFFAKEPSKRTGQNITVMYSRDEPSKVMTPDNRELAGAAVMYIKLAVSTLIAFGIIFAVLYCLCKYGLPDD